MTEIEPSQNKSVRSLEQRSSVPSPDSAREVGLAQAQKVRPSSGKPEPTWSGGGYKVHTAATGSSEGQSSTDQAKLLSIEGKIDQLLEMLADAISESRRFIKIIGGIVGEKL